MVQFCQLSQGSPHPPTLRHTHAAALSSPILLSLALALGLPKRQYFIRLRNPALLLLLPSLAALPLLLLPLCEPA